MMPYTPQPDEQEALANLQFGLFRYNLLKNLIKEKNIPLSFTVQQYFDTTEGSIAEEASNVAYLDVLNEPADSLLTMYNVFGSLKANNQIWQEAKKMVVVGDAKTYFHIISLVNTYPEEFENFVPFPETGTSSKISSQCLWRYSSMQASSNLQRQVASVEKH